MIDYAGDDIQIEEMPQGCIISNQCSDGYVRISSTADALAVIESLQKMIKIQLGEDEVINE